MLCMNMLEIYVILLVLLIFYSILGKQWKLLFFCLIVGWGSYTQRTISWVIVAENVLLFVYFFICLLNNKPCKEFDSTKK